MDIKKLSWLDLRRKAKEWGVNWKPGKKRVDIEKDLFEAMKGTALSEEELVKTAVWGNVGKKVDAEVVDLMAICGILWKQIRDGGERRKILDIRANAEALLVDRTKKEILTELANKLIDGADKEKVKKYINEVEVYGEGDGSAV